MTNKTTRTTEQSSLYNNLEKMSTDELLKSINEQDQTVPLAIKKVLPKIKKVIN
jgi:N-acetylmuramic acid 6-phosphate etherase